MYIYIWSNMVKPLFLRFNSHVLIKQPDIRNELNHSGKMLVG